MQQFARVQTETGTVPVVIAGEARLDPRPIVADITPDTIASGALSRIDLAALKPVSGPPSYLAPISGCRQIAATGFNYKKHIDEFKMTPPKEPEVFLKAFTSVVGPNDPISRGRTRGSSSTGRSNWRSPSVVRHRISRQPRRTITSSGLFV